MKQKKNILFVMKTLLVAIMTVLMISGVDVSAEEIPTSGGKTKDTATEITANTEYNWCLDGNKGDYAVFTATKSGKQQVSFTNSSSYFLSVEVYEYDTDVLVSSKTHITKDYKTLVTLVEGRKYYIYFGASVDNAAGSYSFMINDQAVESIELSESIVNIDRDGTAQLSATVAPATAYDTSVTWACKDSSIASVNSEGKITPKATGVTTITCTANDGSGVVATCKLIVNPKKITYFVKGVTDSSASSFYVKWTGVSNASGYTVYCYDTKTKKYVAVKSVGKNTTNATIKEVKVNSKATKLTAATAYKIKVAAYVLEDGKKYYGPKSDVFTCITAPAKPKLTSVKASGRSITVTWDKVSGADGYEVYVKQPNGSLYYRVALIEKNSTTKYTYKGTWAGTYSIKVRAYKKLGNYSFPGAASAVKTIKVK